MRSPTLPKSSSFPAPRRAAAAGGGGGGGGAGGGKGCAPLSWPVPAPQSSGRCSTAAEGDISVCAGRRGQSRTAAGRREPPGGSAGIDATTGRSCPGISASGLCGAVSLPLVWLHLPPCRRHPFSFSSSSRLSRWLCMNLHLRLHAHNTRTPERLDSAPICVQRKKACAVFSEERRRKRFESCVRGVVPARLVT